MTGRIHLPIEGRFTTALMSEGLDPGDVVATIDDNGRTAFVWSENLPATEAVGRAIWRAAAYAGAPILGVCEDCYGERRADPLWRRRVASTPCPHHGGSLFQAPDHGLPG